MGHPPPSKPTRPQDFDSLGIPEPLDRLLIPSEVGFDPTEK